MDLFNPPKLFNYKTMSHKLDVSKLDNPYVQVIWEDTPENFTQERIKSVKQYFQKKYVTTNVNVITKVKLVEEDNTNLRKDIKKIKTKNTIIEIVSGAIVGALTYIVVFK